jgi:hypothetical protein
MARLFCYPYSCFTLQIALSKLDALKELISVSIRAKEEASLAK